MRRRTAWLGVLAALTVLLLLQQAPARLVAWFVPADQVLVSAWSGTLWHGAAQRVLLAVPGGYLHLGTVRWRLQLSSLLRLRPTVTVATLWPGQTASAVVTGWPRGPLQLSQLEVRAPAALLGHWLPLQLGGTLDLQQLSLVLGGGGIASAQGRVVWDNAAWQGSGGVYPLGTYVLELGPAGDGAMAAGRILTLAGPVQAEGSLALTALRNYRVDLAIGPRSSLAEELEQALALLAQPEPEHWRVQLQGSW